MLDENLLGLMMVSTLLKIVESRLFELWILCRCVCIYVCIYIYLDVYMYIFICIYTQKYVCMHDICKVSTYTNILPCSIFTSHLKKW